MGKCLRFTLPSKIIIYVLYEYNNSYKSNLHQIHHCHRRPSTPTVMDQPPCGVLSTATLTRSSTITATATGTRTRTRTGTPTSTATATAAWVPLTTSTPSLPILAGPQHSFCDTRPPSLGWGFGVGGWVGVSGPSPRGWVCLGSARPGRRPGRKKSLRVSANVG